MRRVSSSLLALVAFSGAANATEQATTVAQQIAENKVAISISIGCFIVACIVIGSIVKTMYEKAKIYNLRGIFCWQFLLLAFLCVIAFTIGIVIESREGSSSGLLETLLTVVTPGFIIVGFSNIRKSNVSFGLAWTLLQLLQAMFIGFVVAVLIFKLFEKFSK